MSRSDITYLHDDEDGMASGVATSEGDISPVESSEVAILT